MLERELALSASPEAPAIAEALAAFKHDAARRLTDLDARRTQLVAWYNHLSG